MSFCIKSFFFFIIFWKTRSLSLLLFFTLFCDVRLNEAYMHLWFYYKTIHLTYSFVTLNSWKEIFIILPTTVNFIYRSWRKLTRVRGRWKRIHKKQLNIKKVYVEVENLIFCQYWGRKSTVPLLNFFHFFFFRKTGKKATILTADKKKLL